ncbi:MAG: hypothetical protein LBQ01_04005 [Prevotellaceae bacterium]|nr:hypothetical protein [Prevotellaceae bacterium]
MALFRETQLKLLEATVYEKTLAIFVEIVEKLLDILCIDVNESMKKIIANDEVSKSILNSENKAAS